MVETVEQIDTLTTIDPHGDVRLVLDDGTLQVSRKALCLSSPVFLAMLGDDSQFWEASDEAVGKGQIRDTPLREDDFGTMEIVMRIIHLQNDTVPMKVSFQQLNKIAVVCDKYALRQCLIPWSFLWSQPYLNSVEKDGFESWLFISIVFRNEDAFTRITKHLILNTSLSSSSILSNPRGINLEEGIPEDIICQIKKQRATAIEAIQKLFRNLMLTLLYNTSQPVCELPEKNDHCDRSNLGCLLQTFPHLCDSSAKDAINSTITSTMTKIQHVHNYGSELKFHRIRDTPGDHADCGLDKILLPEVTAIIRSVQGLVLNPKFSK